MDEAMLPQEFADLERFAPDWCLASEAERYAKRLGSTLAELQEFYEAASPRLRDAMSHLDAFPLHDLPPRELHLIHLMYSLIMVSLPVEVWHQPRVVDAGTAYFDRSIDPGP
jgi:hypothetical protein